MLPVIYCLNIRRCSRSDEVLFSPANNDSPHCMGPRANVRILLVCKNVEYSDSFKNYNALGRAAGGTRPSVIQISAKAPAIIGLPQLYLDQ